MILSYLEGKTNEEVAKLLRWPVGTVKGRLSRARDLLRRRLVRRGLALSATFLMTALSHGTVFAEVVPADLVSRTVRLAARYGSRVASTVPTGAAPPDALEPILPQPVERTTGLKGGLLRLKQQTWGRFFVTILAFLLASGIWMAALRASGLTSELRTAISKFLPASEKLQPAVPKLIPASELIPAVSNIIPERRQRLLPARLAIRLATFAEKTANPPSAPLGKRPAIAP